MRSVRVELGDRSYPIYIGQGLLDQVGSFLHERHPLAEFFIITDETVARLYGDQVRKSITNAGLSGTFLIVPPGEQSKSFEQSQYLYTEMIRRAASRAAIVVALGGGVIGDLAGFVAATLFRGIKFIQIPTTLLAQVDSSVGGKVGINHPLGKNLIGAFHQPELVLIDPEVLRTLAEREIVAGLAEVIKYGFIRDADLLYLIKKQIPALLNLTDLELVSSIIETCCRIKADIVRQDEREAGLRALLNFGHTVGHALETATEYRVFLHGEAVLIGMAAALHLAEITRHLAPAEAASGLALIRSFQVPPIPTEITAETLHQALKKDKKRTHSGQNWILLKRTGQAFITSNVSLEQEIASLHFILKSTSNKL